MATERSKEGALRSLTGIPPNPSYRRNIQTVICQRMPFRLMLVFLVSFTPVLQIGFLHGEDTAASLTIVSQRFPHVPLCPSKGPNGTSELYLFAGFKGLSG